MDLEAQALRRAKRQAYRFLAVRGQTSYELRDRLQRRGYTAAVIDEVLHQLAVEGYIDDRKFAFDWARYRLQTKPLGRRRLAWELQRRGITQESLEEVLRAVYAEFDEVALAEQVARRRLGRRAFPDSTRACQRFAHYLMGLGFEADTIAAVFRNISHSPISLEMGSTDDSV
jgi:regulatory protein